MSRTAIRAALALFAFLPALHAGAATTLTVTTTNMTRAVDGGCSLVEAFDVVRTDTTQNECVGGTGGPYTINLPANATFVATNVFGTAFGNAAVPDVTTGVSILIEGNSSTIERDPVAPDLRFLTVINYNVTMRNLTIRNFNSSGLGGGVYAQDGTVEFDRVTFDGNFAPTGAAVVVNIGATVNVLASTFTGNGGPESTIRTGNGGMLNVANSTFSGNPAGLDIASSNAGAVSLTHNTLSNQFLYQDAGTVNAIGNAFAGGCIVNGASVITAAFNIGAGCPGAVSTDVSTFQALGFHGGPTQTRPFAIPSTAKDADTSCTFASSGTNNLFTNGAPITADQRGVARDAGACDIGAVEARAISVVPAILPTATQGVPYTTAISASGTTSPYTFSLVSGWPASFAVTAPAASSFALAGTAATGAGTTFNGILRTADSAGFAAFTTHSLPVIGVPGAPTVTGVLGDNANAVVTVDVAAGTPANGSPITSYRVRCTSPVYDGPPTASLTIVFSPPTSAAYSFCRAYATNAVGEGPGSVTSFGFTLATTLAASPTRANPSPTNASSVTWHATFNRPVTGVDASDFSLAAAGIAGASITSVTGSGAIYLVTANTGTGSGTLGLNVLDDNSIVDISATSIGGPGAGNGGVTGALYTIDRVAPVVASIVRTGAPTVAAGMSVGYTVTFSKPVTGVDASDFLLAATGTAAGTVSGVTGSGTTYTVTLSVTAPGGTLRLDLADNDSIMDAVTNRLGGAGAGNGSFSAGDVYTVAASVRTFTAPSPTGTGSITATFTGGGPGCTFATAQFIPQTGHPQSPPAGALTRNVIFRHGLFDFTTASCTAGSTITLVITYPTALDAGTQYYKYGPTTATPAPHWYVMPSTVLGNDVTFSITDGGLGDDDLAANGAIVDQGGPGVLAPALGLPAVPALAEWALVLLGLMMFGFAVLMGRKLE